MSKAHFVPAIGEQFNHTWEKGLNFKNFDLKFFTEKSHFQHNVGLQSAYYGLNGVGKKKEKTFRDMIGYPKDKKLIGDSVDYEEIIAIREIGTNNVKYNNIGTFVDDFLKINNNKSETGHDFCNINNYEILTMNDNLEICWRKINQVIRHKVKKKCLYILTDNIKDIKITEDHSIIKFDEFGKLIVVKGDQIKKNDELISVIGFENNIFNYEKVKVLEIKEDSFTKDYVYDLSVDNVERFFCSDLLVHNNSGFQLASFKLNDKPCDMKPIDSLRWQEQNCDIGLNLDFPPAIIGNVTFKEFKRTLDISVKNFELFEKERKNYDMKLYNVFHGDTIEEMELWYNAVKHFKFDGWATGVKPSSNPMIQALGALFLYEKGELTKENCFGFHFLGMSGKHVVPMIVYFASKLDNKFVTYDSSSYNIGSIYRTYYNRLDIGTSLSFGEKFKRQNPNIKTLPCMCPVCQSIDDLSVLNGGDIYAGTLISLHNMYQYIDYVNILNSLVEHKDLFLDFLKAMNVNDKCFMSIEFIDFVLQNGLQAGIKKYCDWIIPEKSDKTVQKTIFTCSK